MKLMFFVGLFLIQLLLAVSLGIFDSTTKVADLFVAGANVGLLGVALYTVNSWKHQKKLEILLSQRKKLDGLLSNFLSLRSAYHSFYNFYFSAYGDIKDHPDPRAMRGALLIRKRMEEIRSGYSKIEEPNVVFSFFERQRSIEKELNFSLSDYNSNRVLLGSLFDDDSPFEGLLDKIDRAAYQCIFLKLCAYEKESNELTDAIISDIKLLHDEECRILDAAIKSIGF